VEAAEQGMGVGLDAGSPKQHPVGANSRGSQRFGAQNLDSIWKRPSSALRSYVAPMTGPNPNDANSEFNAPGRALEVDSMKTRVEKVPIVSPIESII